MPADYYNDKRFSYQEYWRGREYEHESELIALRRCLGKRHFAHIVDLGGGYGRLVPELLKFGDKVTLVEPAAKQRQLARQFLSKDKRIQIVAGSDRDFGLAEGCADLAVVVRVMHHLEDLNPLLTEVSRILVPEGLAVFEFANSLNIKARLRGWIFGSPVSKYPIDMRSVQNQNDQTINFLNHHPETVGKTLRAKHFESLKMLSVSNLRSPTLKKLILLKILLLGERFLQPILAGLYYGPSMFILARKLDN